MAANYRIHQYTWTSEDVAKRLKYNVQYVRQLAAKRLIPALKRRRKWMFCEAEVMDYLRSLNPDEALLDDVNNKMADNEAALRDLLC